MSNPATDAEGKSSKHHVKVFRAEEIKNDPDIELTKGGMILFALLSGGDYSAVSIHIHSLLAYNRTLTDLGHQGVRGIGPQIAHGLARCGFGERLITAYDDMGPRGILAFLPQWRAEINSQLHTNSKGLLPHRCPSVILPDDFPDLQVLVNYAYPISSETAGSTGGSLTDKGDLSIPGLAGFCEDHFDEWGYRSKIVDRFRDLVWHAALMTVLRRAALQADEKEKTKRIAAGRQDTAIRGPLEPSAAEGIGTPATLVKRLLDTVQEDLLSSAFVNKGPQAGPSRPANVKVLDEHPLIAKIIGFRTHNTTDKLPEYRIELNPKQFVELAHTGIKDKRPDPGETRDLKKPRPEPLEPMKVWVPASMMKHVHPRLVEEYQAARIEEAAGGTAKKARRTRTAHRSDDEDDHPASPTKGKGRPRATVKQGTGSQPQAGPSRLPPVEIPADSPSSLPQRQCGFLFTFPNPDNPDHLLSDEEDDMEVDAVANTSLNGRHMEPTDVDSTARPANIPTQRRARHSEPANMGSQQSQDNGGDADSEEEGPQTYTAAWIDNVLFGGGAKKQKTKSTKPRKRARKSHLDDVDQADDQAAPKRQKISEQPPIVDSSSSVARSNNRPIASFPELPPLGGSSSIRDVRHSYADTPLAQVYPQAGAMDADSNDDVVGLGTGGNSRKGKTPVRNARPGRRVYVPPSLSQDSKLGDDFLGDADLVIDLT